MAQPVAIMVPGEESGETGSGERYEHMTGFPAFLTRHHV
jgi:hypothetical protein